MAEGDRVILHERFSGFGPEHADWTVAYKTFEIRLNSFGVTALLTYSSPVGSYSFAAKRIKASEIPRISAPLLCARQRALGDSLPEREEAFNNRLVSGDTGLLPPFCGTFASVGPPWWCLVRIWEPAGNSENCGPFQT